MRRTSGTIKHQANRRKPWASYAPSVCIEGQRYARYLGSYKTKREAELAIAREMFDPSSDYANYTTEDVWEYYTNSKMFAKLSESGKRYNRVAYTHLRSIRNRRFADLRLHDFQECIDRCDKSRSTMKSVQSVISLLSKTAMNLDIISHPYSAGLVIPKEEKEEKQTFTREEIDKMMSSDDRWAKYICVLIYTGMRINEMLSMRREDIYDGCFHGGNKTEAGRGRVIPIHSKILSKVSDICGEEWFCETKNGTRFRDDTFRKEHYYPTLEKLGIRRLTPHCCRHTFFSMMDEKCPDKFAMTLIGGHVDPRFTEKTYVHPDVERLKRAIENI